MTIWDNILLAINSVRANLLRAIMTLLIIAFGIMALVGILTALDSAIYSLSSNFSDMGANSFSINRKYQTIKAKRRGGRRTKTGLPIVYRQAEQFKENYFFPATVSISFYGTSNATLKYIDKKTNPTVAIIGIDENYLGVKGYNVEKGRGFSETEIQNGSPKIIIGKDIVNLLFNGKTEAAIGKTVSIDALPYQVIGVLESKGSSLNSSADRQVMLSMLNVRRIYDDGNSDWNIDVAVANPATMNQATSQALGYFRQVRKTGIGEEEDFEIMQSDGLIEMLEENTANIRMATVAIGLITLLGAAIGLMNIMLVTVTERTREIGICKALGATKRSILIQFLTEAIIICQMGGFVGIVLGILMGNIVSLLLGGSFLIPWAWILLGIVTCFVVGLVSGLYPAMKAAKLDPIESLRYE